MGEDDALWLDGNGVAGILADAFGSEMTTVQRGCAACGSVHPVGAHRAYRSAGIVLRCPSCADVALRIGMLDDRYVLVLSGAWTLEVPHDRG